MTWRPAVLVSILLGLWGCAEGGIRGSGISTSVVGNVGSVQPASTGVPADLSGIAVTIEGTDVADETDAAGRFALMGAFDGRVTVLFELPDAGGEARIDLNVPAGGTLTLIDVDVDAAQGAAVAETATVDFTGSITAADCAGGKLVMTSSPGVPGDIDEYVVQLDTSSLEDSHGTPVPCSAVHPGQRASVQGIVNPDGTFGEATIVLQG